MSAAEVDDHPIKEVSRYSSRFIYLQAAADGIITDTGKQIRQGSVKMKKLMELIKGITAKGESLLVYFDYYASLEVAIAMLRELNLPIKIMESTGAKVLNKGDITEAKVKRIPHVVFCTKASAESESMYYINHCVFFQIPTTVATVVQMAGRILRKNTIYPDDLNLYYFRSENIDLYKLMLVSIKSYQMEVTAGVEWTIPPEYKQLADKAGIIEKQKKLLLWKK